VERSLPGSYFDDGQGVGLARKIGGDVALALQRSGRVESPWILCTDADVQLPADYLDLENEGDAAALVCPFFHESPDAALQKAAATYEAYLHYYVAGLRYAGSPYAFHTIGSTMIVEGSAYARVRGFPRRRTAGEDFYLLNKLAKVGEVRSRSSRPIRIRARESERVPFGTGASIRQLMAGKALRVYHPAVFDEVRVWLRMLEHLTQGTPWKEALAREGASPLLQGALRELEVEARMERLRSLSSDPAGRRKQWHDWFDGFRTLRLVHVLRDLGPGVVPLADALAEAPFVCEEPSGSATMTG
jgi:hypothetical protein